MVVYLNFQMESHIYPGLLFHFNFLWQGTELLSFHNNDHIEAQCTMKSIIKHE